MKDTARKEPIISAATLFLAMVYSVALGIRSLLQLDQFLRGSAIKNFLGSTRKMVSSDCTYWRVLKEFVIDPVRELSHYIYLRAKLLGKLAFSSPGLKGLKIGLIDGSQFGRHLASCFQVIGEDTELLVDLERMKKKGKELPTSARLIRRLVNRFGKGFVDLMLFDGLYAAKGIINLCISNQVDVLIKTQEEGLVIIQDAQRLFSKMKDFQQGIEYEEGQDHVRGVAYKIWAAVGFEFTGVKPRFKVARVWERDLKGKKEEKVFWVLTTNIDLKAYWLRELGHLRWKIENEGFKALNQLSHSKHTWCKDPKGFEAQMLMRFIGFNLFGLYVSQDGDLLPCSYQGVQRTLKLYSDLLRDSLIYRDALTRQKENNSALPHGP